MEGLDDCVEGADVSGEGKDTVIEEGPAIHPEWKGTDMNYW